MYFINGLAIVKINNKYGFINSIGEEVVTCKYDEASFFNNGLARVKSNDKYGFVNAKGEEIIPCIYDVAQDFGDDGLAGVVLNGKWYEIDTNGKIIER